MQNTLPFEPITDVASRNSAREMLKRAGDIFKIDIRQVRIRPGFNSRYKPEWMDYETYYNQRLAIPEMAALLKAGGQEEAIKGDLMPDGTFYVMSGHRRTMAMQWLIEHDPEGAEQFLEDFKGEKVYMIKVIRNPSDMTETQRLLNTTTSAEQMKLEPLELAYKVLQVKYTKDDDGEYSNDELAKMYGKSRQWVDNQIHLATLPEDIRVQIEKGEISPTQALAIKREEKKAVKKEEKKRAAPEEYFDEEGYILSPKTKAGIKDIEKSFLFASAWKYEREKTMKAFEIDDHVIFSHWNHAFVRSVVAQNLEYQTSLNDYIKDLKSWFFDQTADDPTELHKDEEETPFDGDKEKSEAPTEAAEGNHDEMGRIPGQAGYGEAPVIHDTTSIHSQDDGLLKGTDPNFKDPRPKKDQDGDALGKIDFKKEKTEAEMELNEIKGMVDKINVRMDSLPAAQKQMADDMQRLCAIIQKKIEFVQGIIKKASDER